MHFHYTTCLQFCQKSKYGLLFKMSRAPFPIWGPWWKVRLQSCLLVVGLWINEHSGMAREIREQPTLCLDWVWQQKPHRFPGQVAPIELGCLCFLAILLAPLHGDAVWAQKTHIHTSVLSTAFSCYCQQPYPRHKGQVCMMMQWTTG